MTVFSTQIMARAKRIFEKRSGRAVSAEETEMYLNQLARVGKIAVHVLKLEIKTRKGGEKV